MAGLQITPDMTGISTPIAPTTRTNAVAENVSIEANASQVASNDIRTPVKREPSAVDSAITGKQDRQAAESGREIAEQRREAALENVVSRSEDGDTVQVSDDGEKELTESRSGSVVELERMAAADDLRDERTAEEDIALEPIEAPEIEPIKAPEVKPTAAPEIEPIEVEIPKTDTAAAKSTDTETAVRDTESNTVRENITSFVGYSDQQVEQMYLEGEISQSTYNREIERREEGRAAESANSARLNETMGELGAEADRVERVDFAIEKALESGNNNVSVDERLKMIDSTLAERQDTVRRQEEAGRLWDYQLQV